jgi:hypothetical protein
MSSGPAGSWTSINYVSRRWPPERPPVTVGNFVWKWRVTRLGFPSVTAWPVNVEQAVRSGCRPASHRIRCRSLVASDYARVSDEADGPEHVFHFCPDCGSTVFYREPDVTVVMVGAFADPSFPPPRETGYDSRRHTGWRCPTRSSVTPPSCGNRCDLFTRPAGTRRQQTAAASLSRPTPTWHVSTTRWRAARALLVGQPTPSITCARQSTGGRAVATWRRRTPTSIQSARNPLSRN